MLERFLSNEQDAEDVSVKHSVKLLFGGFFQRHEFVNTGVVNHDVDFAKSCLGFGQEALNF